MSARQGMSGVFYCNSLTGPMRPDSCKGESACHGFTLVHVGRSCSGNFWSPMSLFYQLFTTSTRSVFAPLCRRFVMFRR